MNFFARFIKFINEIKVEMQKVSWSDRNELIASTIVVVVSTLLLSLFIGIADVVLSKFVDILIRL